MDTVRVNLTPTPGFCIKSTTLQPAVCKVSGQAAIKKTETALGPSLLTSPDTLTIPKGAKVFVNIAWDTNVPPAPEGSEDVIQRAMLGEEELPDDTALEGGGWFVPVVVSDPRSDTDKAGKPSVVFDCVYNPQLKSRVLRDPAFRAFLVELGLQRIEAQYSLTLSRQLGQPNIASKGKLPPRSALVPIVLFPPDHAVRAGAEKGRKKLIEEITPKLELSEEVEQKLRIGNEAKPKKKLIEEIEPTQPKSILKNNGSTLEKPLVGKVPAFEWTKDGNKLQVIVNLPGVTLAQAEAATLDVEARRIIVEVPSKYKLDIDLSPSDSEITSNLGDSPNIDTTLALKRQRDFDVDGAKAEWRIAEAKLVISL